MRIWVIILYFVIATTSVQAKASLSAEQEKMHLIHHRNKGVYTKSKGIGTDIKTNVKTGKAMEGKGVTQESQFSITEIAKLSVTDRHKWLFGRLTRPHGKSDWKSEKDSWSEMELVGVDIWRSDAKGPEIPNSTKYSSKRNYTVNKKVAKQFKQIMKEIYEHDAKPTIDNPNDGANYYKTIGKTDKLSAHAFGLGIDLNSKFNPQTRDGTKHPDYKPTGREDVCNRSMDKHHPITKIFTKHGWRWGGDYTVSLPDYMHFEYIE